MNVAISQALASGLPVIATRHSGFPEQVQDGVSGFLVNEGDVEALAERIVFLIQHSELWPAMGRRGREHVEKHYALSTSIDRQIAGYQKVLHAARR